MVGIVGTRAVNCPRCEGETVPCEVGLNVGLRGLGWLLKVGSALAIVLIVIPALDPLGWGEASPGWVLTRIKQGDSPLSGVYKQAGFSSAQDETLRKGPDAFTVAEMELLTQSQKDFLPAFQNEIADSKKAWFSTLRQSGRTASITLIASLVGLWLGGMLAQKSPALSCLRCRYKFCEFERPAAAKPGT